MIRYKPLHRTAFKSKRPKHEPSTEKEEKPMAASTLNYSQGDVGELRAAAVPHIGLRRGVMAKVDEVVRAAPKEEKAKPGKGAPTKAEREWLDAITAYGCIACRIDGRGFRTAAVHHILRGGVRMGHMFTLPLCDPGHHQNGQQFGMVSRHPWKAQFEARYGYELDLRVWLEQELRRLGLWFPLVQK